MLDQETIEQQQALLIENRRRLAVLLEQHSRLGDYAPPHVRLEIEDIQTAIRHLKVELRAAGIAVEDEPNDDAQPIAVAIPSRLSPQEQRNRRAMLAKVKTIWIDGLLEQSLAKELRIALNLTEQPDAVELPLNALVQELNRPPRELPNGTPIIKIFDQMGGALLILGAPGAGKTTLLLELARDLIARAKQDEAHPIPVVFNLSSWASKRQPLKEWLVEELNTRYDVPGKLAQAWMDADAVLPLLDGLDEVAADQRGSCVEAINTYRQEHGLVPLTVCSRAADYSVLGTKLRLQGAIVVQPLTKQQIDAYVERAGDKLAGVRTALLADVELQEMLDTPLMLSIVGLAYKDKPLVELPSGGTLEEQRHHLFDAYIEAMFARRGNVGQRETLQAERRLGWLAQQMVTHNQAVFHTERIQADWLSQWQRHLYRRYARLLIVWGQVLGGVLGSILLGGLCISPLIVLFGGQYEIVLIICLSAQGAALGGVRAIGLARYLNNLTEYVVIREASRRFWSEAHIEIIFSVGLGLFSTLFSYSVLGVFSTLLSSYTPGLTDGIWPCLLFGLSSGVINWPATALKIRNFLLEILIEYNAELIKLSSTTNNVVRLAARNALVFGVIDALGGILGGMLGGVLLGVLISLSEGSTVGFESGLSLGLAGAVAGGVSAGLRGFFEARVMEGGIISILQHYTLRWLLYRNGSLPLRLVPFLDYCAERIFLRKVGGGYIFVHRLLMEHFASLYSEQDTA